ncbi:MAG TPA: MBL fold metallo-hydrolase [Thermoanaerobaculia bacterium]|jgi:beta-lactamase superfamily II metal-dependent hydrolase|nr:MBL fold metallo-hydrolase [Thermoanaerobaculia bacterium]
MARAKKGELRVRMYRVGFGDFFLVTVPSDDGPQHIVIDCGVTPGTTHKGDIGTIKDAVAHMAKETDNKLALIIVTHRHMDHIIGFSRSADLFKQFTVDAIWMSYWETEYDEQAVKMQAELTALALDVQTHLALSARADLDTQDMLGMLRNATGFDHTDLSLGMAAGAKPKTGKGGGTNAASLALLKTGLGVKPEYYAKGDKPKLPKRLAKTGLVAEVLGPPPADALTFMKLTDLKKGVGQYLGADGTTEAGMKFDPFGPAWHATADDYPESAFREWAPRVQGQLPDFSVRHNAALEAAVNASQPSALFTAVKALDSFLNNQSLVVLFTYEGRKLLFVGDAQAGNWEYWMYGGTPTKAPSIDDIAAEGKAVLSSLDFYKVGHHGSTNATPITAVDTMEGDFVSMCSTQEDTFGSRQNASEVPRDPLLAALAKKSAVIRSDDVAVTIGDGVPAASEAPKALPKPARGKLVAGSIYIDYFL